MREPQLVIRAVPSSYVMLSGIWFLLAAGYTYLALEHPDRNLWQVVVGCLAPGLGFVAWLSGFRLGVIGDQLVYRDGFRRTRTVPIADIGTLKFGWFDVGLVNRVKLPRLRVTRKSGGPAILMNAKVFGLQDLRKIEDTVRERQSQSSI